MFRNRLPRTALASVLAAATISTLAAAPAGAAELKRFYPKDCTGVTVKLMPPKVTRENQPLEEKTALKAGDTIVYKALLENINFIDGEGTAGSGYPATTTNVLVNNVEDSSVQFDWTGLNADAGLRIGEKLPSRWEYTVQPEDIAAGKVSHTFEYPMAASPSATPLCSVVTGATTPVNPGPGGGAIAGIVLGVLSALGLIGGLIASLFARR